MICRSPSEFVLPSGADSTISIPIGIGFYDEEEKANAEDDFAPFTEGTQRFRFYGVPYFLRADPDEVDVGKMAEVYVFTDDNTELFERNLILLIIFIAIPTGKGTQGQYGIMCKFGRFGVGMGMYVNKTAIKCLTPSVSDDPDSIWKETV